MPIILSMHCLLLMHYSTVFCVFLLFLLCTNICRRNGKTKLLADTPLDNTAADWAKDAVNWALRNGILKGDERGDLMLHSPVNREQFCVMLKRYADLP